MGSLESQEGKGRRSWPTSPSAKRMSNHNMCSHTDLSLRKSACFLASDSFPSSVGSKLFCAHYKKEKKTAGSQIMKDLPKCLPVRQQRGPDPLCSVRGPSAECTSTQLCQWNDSIAWRKLPGDTAAGAHLDDIFSIWHLLKELSRTNWSRAWSIMYCIRRVVKIMAWEFCNYCVICNHLLACVPVLFFKIKNQFRWVVFKNVIFFQ